MYRMYVAQTVDDRCTFNFQSMVHNYLTALLLTDIC